MKPNILFINPVAMPMDNIQANYHGDRLSARKQVFEEVVMPMGVMYISSYLKKHQDVGEVALLDYSLAAREMFDYPDLESFVRAIAHRDAPFTPDVLAVSLSLTSSHHFVLALLDILKSLWPQAVVIVGGVHATNYTAGLLTQPLVDYVLRGEGERGFAQFVGQLAEGSIIHVKGLYGKAQFPEVLELADMVQDLDEIPFPDWDLIDMEAYVTGITRYPKKDEDQGNKRRMAEIMTTRGCPFRCTFCSSHTVHGRGLRFRSVENVVNEVIALNQRYGVELFFPEDDLFTADKARTIEILKRLQLIGIPHFEMQFPNGLSINTLDEELIDALITAGMKVATLAIESGSEEVQKHLIKKNCNLKNARHIVAYLKSKKIMVRCFFIFGFPGETKAQMRETLDYARTLQADWNDFFVATPLVGSEMYEECIRLGYTSEDPNLWLSSFFKERMFDTPEILASELNEFCYRANLECNFTNNPLKVNGQWKEAIQAYQGVLLKYPFHIIAWYCLMECYREQGNASQERSARDTIGELIRADERAADMYEHYRDIMPLLEA